MYLPALHSPGVFLCGCGCRCCDCSSVCTSHVLVAVPLPSCISGLTASLGSMQQQSGGALCVLFPHGPSACCFVCLCEPTGGGRRVVWGRTGANAHTGLAADSRACSAPLGNNFVAPSLLFPACWCGRTCCFFCLVVVPAITSRRFGFGTFLNPAERGWLRLPCECGCVLTGAAPDALYLVCCFLVCIQ